jgi:hypothetical protein
VLAGAAVPALAHVARPGHPHDAVSAIAPPGAAAGPEALNDPEARQPMDRGVGERVLLVVGGVYPTESAATQAAEEFSLGDLQGYYVLPVSQFDGLREQLSDPGSWVVATGFRTDRGASEFLELVSANGVPGFVTERVRNLGPRFFGLGQESNPEGTGPQVGAIPGVTT